MRPVVAVAPLVVADGCLSVAPRGDDRLRALALQQLSQTVRVIPLVRDEVLDGACGFQQFVGGRDVGDVAGRKTQDGRSAQKVRHGVDLGGLAAARRSDGLRFRPPSSPCAERCAFT